MSNSSPEGSKFTFAGIPVTAHKRDSKVNEICEKYAQDTKKLLETQIPKSSKLVLFRMCVNHELLFHMFVDNSTEDQWKKADDTMLDFFRKVTGKAGLPPELIQLSWEKGGLGSILPTTQKKAVDQWKKDNLVYDRDRIVKVKEGERTIFARVQQGVAKLNFEDQWE